MTKREQELEIRVRCLEARLSELTKRVEGITFSGLRDLEEAKKAGREAARAAQRREQAKPAIKAPLPINPIHNGGQIFLEALERESGITAEKIMAEISFPIGHETALLKWIPKTKAHLRMPIFRRFLRATLQPHGKFADEPRKEPVVSEELVDRWLLKHTGKWISSDQWISLSRKFYTFLPVDRANVASEKGRERARKRWGK